MTMTLLSPVEKIKAEIELKNRMLLKNTWKMMDQWPFFIYPTICDL